MLVSRLESDSLWHVDEQEAIETYNRGGDAMRGRLGSVHWPDIAVGDENLERLAEGLIESRIDLTRLAFGDDFDPEAFREELDEAWRTDELRARYAPEGVIVRAAFTIRLSLLDRDDGADEPETIETLCLELEFCLSFVERFHARPFVDFMGGKARRAGDGMSFRLEPFACKISPADAVTWGMNGCVMNAD